MNYIQRIYDLLVNAQVNEGMRRDFRKIGGLTKARWRAEQAGLRDFAHKKNDELEQKVLAAKERTARAKTRSDARLATAIGGTYTQRKVLNTPKGGGTDIQRNMADRTLATADNYIEDFRKENPR